MQSWPYAFWIFRNSEAMVFYGDACDQSNDCFLEQKYLVGGYQFDDH